MARNIEIKARAAHFGRQGRLAAEISEGPAVVLAQTDTFFRCNRGRLKLRETGAGEAELIYYDRLDQRGPKRSEYFVFRTDDPGGLRAVLGASLGIRGTVRKKRLLYLAGATRIHLDEVDGLGEFIELEVVLGEGQTEADGQRIAETLMGALEIRPEDLVEGAYMDMLEK